MGNFIHRTEAGRRLVAIHKPLQIGTVVGGSINMSVNEFFLKSI